MDIPVGNEGELTGTTPKTVLAAPAADVQRVVPNNGLSVYNGDTVPHDIFFQKNKASTITVFWVEIAVPAGTHVVLPKRVVLDADDESLEVLTDATATTDEPTFDLAAMECS